MSDTPRTDAVAAKAHGSWNSDFDAMTALAYILESELAQCREALEFYAKHENYFEACLNLQEDGGHKARAALVRIDK